MVSKRRIALAGITAAVVAAGLVTTVVARAAAPACRVDYRVPSQWPGGFTGSVTVTNLGDPITGWQVTWAFTAGQQVTQAWYTNLTQSGAQVTAANPAWLPSLATGGSAVAAIDLVKAAGARHITLVCIVSAPEGVALVQARHPEVAIYTPVVDRELNAHKFIVPGLGDFGDRLYGT